METESQISEKEVFALLSCIQTMMAPDDQAVFSEVFPVPPCEMEEVEVATIEAGGPPSLASSAIRKKKKKKVKDPNAPKRYLSAFMYYSQENRTRIRQENPSTSFADVAKILGQNWKELPVAERKIYEEIAKNDKVRFNREMVAYSSCEHQGLQTSGSLRKLRTSKVKGKRTEDEKPEVARKTQNTNSKLELPMRKGDERIGALEGSNTLEPASVRVGRKRKIAEGAEPGKKQRNSGFQMVLVPPLNDRSRRATRFDGTPQTMIGKKIKVLCPPSSSEYREAVVENFNVQSKKYILRWCYQQEVSLDQDLKDSSDLNGWSFVSTPHQEAFKKVGWAL